MCFSQTADMKRPIKGFSEEEIKMLSSMTDKVENNLWEAINNEEQK